MYCHPKAVRRWAKSLKPACTSMQAEQARIMRQARVIKREFNLLQRDLFNTGANQ